MSRQLTKGTGKLSNFSRLALFLSSTGAAHMTGNVLEIDRGSTLSGFRGKRNQPKI